jgi:hypothetical protein
MNNPKSHPNCRLLVALCFSLTVSLNSRAMEALLLQDTYVDSTKNPANNGANANLRVTKSGNQICRSFLKFQSRDSASRRDGRKSDKRASSFMGQ